MIGRCVIMEILSQVSKNWGMDARDGQRWVVDRCMTFSDTSICLIYLFVLFAVIFIRDAL